MSNKEKLFTEFQAPSKQEWLDKIQVDLKGADFEKKLVWRTNEGFNMQPFYRREDIEGLQTPNALPGEFPFVRGNKKDNNVWYVRQDIVVENAKEANAKALDILNKGVDSLGFKIKREDVSAEFVETLLSGIECECVELNFSTCNCKSVELAEHLAAYFDKKGKELWKQAQPYLLNPVEERIFCDDLLSNDSFPGCGINALAHYTWLNPDSERMIMMPVKQLREFKSSGTLVRPNEFDGNIIIEAWKYPPVTAIGTKAEWVDRLSLAISLSEDEDPRVEGEVERLINEIEWNG